MKTRIWDFWAKRYHRLWVQKKSLKPTREYAINLLEKEWQQGARSLLDLGCGPGELLHMAMEKFKDIQATGVDFSQGMLEISRKRNPGARHILMDAENIKELEGGFDMVTCTHSLPYYKNREKILGELERLLNPHGKLILAFASGNSVYDKVALFFVKLTTGPAYYPSDKEFMGMIKDRFHMESRHVIRESFYMPTIAVYTLRRL